MFLIESLCLLSVDAGLVPGERDMEQEMHDRSHAITVGREEMPAPFDLRGIPPGDGRAAAHTCITGRAGLVAAHRLALVLFA